jgi:hypothetical protein
MPYGITLDMVPPLHIGYIGLGSQGGGIAEMVASSRPPSRRLGPQTRCHRRLRRKGGDRSTFAGGTCSTSRHCRYLRNRGR